MNADVITVSEDIVLDAIIDLFLRNRIRRVFVTRDKKLLGVISRRDLVITSQMHKQVHEYSSQFVSPA